MIYSAPKSFINRWITKAPHTWGVWGAIPSLRGVWGVRAVPHESRKRYINNPLS